jgi:hypothetical protein
MGDDGFSASELRKRNLRGGSVPDDQLSCGCSPCPLPPPPPAPSTGLTRTSPPAVPRNCARATPKLRTAACCMLGLLLSHCWQLVVQCTFYSKRLRGRTVSGTHPARMRTY